MQNYEKKRSQAYDKMIQAQEEYKNLETREAWEYVCLASGHKSVLQNRHKLTIGLLKAALKNIPDNTPLRLETINEDEGCQDIVEFGAVRVDIRDNGAVIVGDYEYEY